LVFERRLGDDGRLSGGGAHDAHAGAKDTDGANEYEGFVIGA
jgi:hypothetical protein